MSEEWRPVVGYEGAYEVSNKGRVRGLDRTYTRHGYPVRVKGRMLKGYYNDLGYHWVALGYNRRGLVHRMVLEAFVGPAPADKPNGLHYDGDPGNNDLSNLRWGSQFDNMQDMLRHGRNWNAAKTHCANGHEYTPANTIAHDGNGKGRSCRVCRRATQLRFYERRRQEREAAGIVGPWIGDEIKLEIERRLASGETGRSIAADLGVAPATVSRIRTGKDADWNRRRARLRAA